ncbi:MAG: hypothetical protein ABIQ27_02235 [Flavobacterium sp.]|uniref:hypothetical protein n=1 Tax=Flavobacterium sp. TaxID=239 RepID=UPI003266F2A1
MKKNKICLVLISCLLLLSCNKKEDVFPIEKRYWTVEDYEDVIREIKFGVDAEEHTPKLSDPETKAIVEKLTDEENFKVVLEDNQLGLKHKNEVAQGFFNAWENMMGIYNVTDRQDKYIYEIEHINCYKFGLGLQLRYFKLGNDEIIENADDKNDSSTTNNVNSNINALVGNYENYLDEINDENAFSQNGLNAYAEGIDKYFSELIKLYPDADYSGLKTKIELMLKKAKSPSIITSLNKIKSLIPAEKTV